MRVLYGEVFDMLVRSKLLGSNDKGRTGDGGAGSRGTSTELKGGVEDEEVTGTAE